MPAAGSQRTHPYSGRYRIRRDDRYDRCCKGRRSHASSDQCNAVLTRVAYVAMATWSVVTHFAMKFNLSPVRNYLSPRYFNILRTSASAGLQDANPHHTAIRYAPAPKIFPNANHATAPYSDCPLSFLYRSSRK